MLALNKQQLLRPHKSLRMKISQPLVVFFVIVSFFVAGASFVMAASSEADGGNYLAVSNKGNNYGLDYSAQRTGLFPTADQGSLTLPGIIGRFIQPVIMLVGVFFLVLIIYAGIMWMTAAGNEEQVTKAKNTITSAVIGLLVVLLSYGLTFLIARYLIGSEEIKGLCIQQNPTIQCIGYVDFQQCPIEEGAIFDPSFLSCTEGCQPPTGTNDYDGYFCE